MGKHFGKTHYIQEIQPDLYCFGRTTNWDILQGQWMASHICSILVVKNYQSHTIYLLTSECLLWTKASISAAFRGRFKFKSLAHSSIPGNIISKPIGVCCFSSLIESKFDSINLMPVTREGILILFILWRKRNDLKIEENTFAHLFFTNTPPLQCQDRC